MKLTIDDKFLLLKELSKDEIKIIKKDFTWNDYKNAYLGGSFNKRNI